MSQDEILQRIGSWISEGSRRVVESVNNHYCNIVKYKPLKGSSYIELYRWSCKTTRRV